MVAKEGWPVIRFDRRGVGDSGGANEGYASAAPDILIAQRCAAHIGAERVVAFGNCDAATALATLPLHSALRRGFADPAPIVARVLANPWLADRENGLPPRAAIRDRYRRRASDPAMWRALLTGKIDLAKLRKGLLALLPRRLEEPRLLSEIAAGLERLPLPTRIVLSRRDATGLAFHDAWSRFSDPVQRQMIPIEWIDTASHNFTQDDDLSELRNILVAALTSNDETV
jgi:hypothetical protein